jgi:hypothetical protein
MPAAAYALPSSSWERICSRPAVALIVVKVVLAAWPQIASVTTSRYVVRSASWVWRMAVERVPRRAEHEPVQRDPGAAGGGLEVDALGRDAREVDRLAEADLDPRVEVEPVELVQQPHVAAVRRRAEQSGSGSASRLPVSWRPSGTVSRSEGNSDGAACAAAGSASRMESAQRAAPGMRITPLPYPRTPPPTPRLRFPARRPCA